MNKIKLFRIYSVLLFLPMFCLFNWVCTPMAHGREFLETEITAILRTLDRVPQTQGFVERFLRDGEIPWHYKKIFWLLVTENIAVHSATEDVKKIWNMNPDFTSTYVIVGKQSNLFLFTSTKNTEINLNTEAKALFSEALFTKKEDKKPINLPDWYDQRNQDPTKRINILFIRDGVSQNYNCFLSFIHELSHIKFNLFLDRYAHHLISLYKRNLVPKIIIQDLSYISQSTPHQLFMNIDLQTFLTERFSWTNEYRYLKLILKYSEKIESKFGSFFSDILKKELNAIYDKHHKNTLARYLLECYHITDPDVAPLINNSLYQIFHGHISNLSDPKFHLPHN